MKFYVHYEGEPSFTLVFRWEETNLSTVADLKKLFVAAYNRKFGPKFTLDAEKIIILSENKTKLSDATLVVNIVSDLEDLFAVVAPFADQSQPIKDVTTKNDIQERILRGKGNISVVEEGKSTSERLKVESQHRNVDPVQEISPQQKEQLAEKLKSEGNRLMQMKKYNEALEKYTDAINLNPINPIYYANRAQAYISLQKYEEAIADCNNCLLLDRKNAKAYFRKAVALYCTGKFEMAKSTLQEGLLCPELSEIQRREFSEMLAKCIEAEKNAELSIKETNLDNIAENEDLSRMSREEVTKYINKALMLAEQAEKTENFRYAAALYEQILQIEPWNQQSLLRLGTIYLKAHKYDNALAIFATGAQKFPDLPLWIELLGDTYYEKGEYDKALQFYEATTTILKARQQTSERLPETDYVNKDLLIKVKIGKCFYALGDKEYAAQIFVAILQRKEEHFEALYAYGVYLRDVGRNLDALRIFLNLLIKKSDDKRVREQLSECIKCPNGLQLLKEELNQVPSSAPAFAFLGTIVKDYGACEESAQLYTEALRLRPDYASYALSLVHVYEILNKYQEAFDQIKTFCKRNATFHVSSLSCAHVYNAICHIHSLLPLRSHLSDTEQISIQYEFPSKPQNEAYNSDELDLLALFCTLVKILYVVGCLEIIPPLIKLINPVREGRPLHTTNIRNEIAYFCQISQIWPYLTLPLPQLPTLYIAGDSHCMCAAWQTVNFQGAKYILRPLLVTGLKVWHLRPESKFYPKYNFYNTVTKVPKGSPIIFLFGEIDCRESFIVSVQKCRYKDVEEAATVTVDIYLKTLKELQQQYDYKIIIHPVIPAIDVTRPIVKIYNRILKEKIQKETNFVWLDFFEKLLTPDGEKLHPDYELDGTHINPKYVQNISQCLEHIHFSDSKNSSNININVNSHNNNNNNNNNTLNRE
jgi:tetratricopeptide (TPR) repeat protein